MKRRYGFTLIELLVVVAIIALLVSILMPALGRARELANQVKCATQLNGIGKAMALYQNDYKDSNPSVYYGSAGDTKGPWRDSYGGPQDSQLTDYWACAWPKYSCNSDKDWWKSWPDINGALWLLVKYTDLVPNMFLCPSADYAEEMDLSDASFINTDIESWADCRNFRKSNNNCYSYNDIYKHLLDASSSSSLVVMADKSNRSVRQDDVVSGLPDPQAADRPLLGTAWDGDTDNPDVAIWTDEADALRYGNSPNHATEVQNVLFADTHVKKYDKPIVGMQDDNIYTTWSVANPTGNQLYLDLYQGLWGSGSTSFPRANIVSGLNDTFLVN